MMTTELATRITRIERLIGTTPTNGVRGDLARARASKLAGFATAANGMPIDLAIDTYERCLAGFEATLADLKGR